MSLKYEPLIQKSMSLKCEPASEPLHISKGLVSREGKRNRKERKEFTELLKFFGLFPWRNRNVLGAILWAFIAKT